MDFDTPKNSGLRESLDRLLGDSYGFDKRKGYWPSRKLQRRDVGRYAEMGLLGLPSPRRMAGSVAARST